MSSSAHTPRLTSVHPLDAVCVALALDEPAQGQAPALPARLQAVRFQGGVVLDRLSIPLALPGSAPDADARAAFRRFVGDAALVGYDLPALWCVLALHDLRPANTAWDIRELAMMLLPGVPSQSLPELAGRILGEGAASGPPAGLAHLLYLALVDKAQQLGSTALAGLASYAGGPSPEIAGLLSALVRPSATAPGFSGGLDHRSLAKRLERPRPLGQPRKPQVVSPGEVEALLSADGPLALQFPRYEPRPQQVAMARAVAEALAPTDDDSLRLMVEGGTGIGKSVAYLLPAILFAARNNLRVVVSTDTINLQEQLIRKDIPQLVAALSTVPGLDLSSFRYTQLKGKANYLCLRRWETLAASQSLTSDEAATISKTMAWLQTTQTGDRAELQLRSREMAVWDRLSSANFSTCPGAREGACFYRYAREQTASAHLVVVNHALLLSDLLVGGTLLPEYDYLIVDEAHNLEEEATRQFGFRLSQSAVEELVEQLLSSLQGLGFGLRVSPLDAAHKEAVQRRIEEAQAPLSRVRDHWARLAISLTAFVAAQRSTGGNGEDDLRITAASRSQPAWSDLEIVWDNFDRALADAERQANILLRGIEQLPPDTLPGAQDLSLELGEWLQRQAEVRHRVAGFIAHPEESMVYWVGQGPAAVAGRTSIALNGAPLDVAGHLQQQLFSQKRGVVLTSATLVIRGQFTHLRKRLGLDEAAELHLDSPFDYKQAALLCVPADVPEPSAPGYLEALTGAIRDLATVAHGHTMVLFTSHAMLRAAAQVLRASLAGEEIGVLAQGVDGAPQQLLSRFQQDPCAVLLGTASFWEGVDIGNSALKVLVVARLPFNVPTEPVFAARSELYEQPFIEYAVPQAVLRFRQGFGRLIRSSDDRGAVVVLDRRVRSKAYGKWFLASVPPATTFHGPMRQVVGEVRRWLARPSPEVRAS